MPTPEISFIKRGEESEYRDYLMREYRLDPDGKRLADYEIRDSEGKCLGIIQEDPGRKREYIGLWSVVIYWLPKQLFCYPNLLPSLEEAQTIARQLIGHTLEELELLYPEFASWAL